MAPVPVNTRGRSCPISISIEILMKLRSKNMIPLKNATTKEEFQGECLALGSEIIATQPIAADWSETGQVPQC